MHPRPEGGWLAEITDQTQPGNESDKLYKEELKRSVFRIYAPADRGADGAVFQLSSGFDWGKPQ